ncbi:MAG TPA: hypothetical protein VE172_19935 [Stackebrandtia sp.]|uniref:hypothetical protein n=1 Tax=Stackebrandtia sp. TaxID=2023065 RepID=UPI002D5326A8|nr:hypothetical protein [Stackebrandtia sp.]HZE41076.1 hypothetical protein [Stackebrandtia sp.]
MDTNDQAGDASKALPKKPKVPKLVVWVAVGVVLVTGISVAILSSGLGLFDGASTGIPGAHHSSNDSKDGTYKSTGNLCSSFDTKLYRKVVGEEPKTTGSTKDGSNSGKEAYCALTSDDKSSHYRYFQLAIRARVYQSPSVAKSDFQDALGLTDVPVSSMDPISGPWQQGAIYVAKNVDQYFMFIQDDNLTAGIVQAARPFSELSKSDALKMMRTYAEQALKALKK